jgi:splicing factor 3A subunit 3
MMEILERQRNVHEDIERMRQAVVDRMAKEPRTRYDALATEQQVTEFLTAYRDENGARAREIESMAGSTNEFNTFYQEDAELREILPRHLNLQVEDLEKNYFSRDGRRPDHKHVYRRRKKLPAKLKSNDYLKYLIVLQEYLESFLKRIQPIVNHRKLTNRISADFAKVWGNVSAGPKRWG